MVKKVLIYGRTYGQLIDMVKFDNFNIINLDAKVSEFIDENKKRNLDPFTQHLSHHISKIKDISTSINDIQYKCCLEIHYNRKLFNQKIGNLGQYY